METVQALSDYELERGKPMPSRNHALVQVNLIAAFLPYKEKYSILSELALDIAKQPYTPDISIYPKLPVDWRHDEIKMAKPPLMVVEILSPTQSLDDLVHKADVYFEAGIKSCWIVQPTVETIIVLEPGQRRKVFSAGEVTDSVTEITVTVEDVFQ